MKYQWLIDEAAKVKTNGFFDFKRQVTPDLIQEIETKQGALPEDYKSFLLLFGHSSLFRDPERGAYMLDVLSQPIEKVQRGKVVLHFGYCFNGGPAYFLKDIQTNWIQNFVVEDHSGGFRKCANSFSEWLEKKFRSSRRLFNKKEWKEILEGPRPFNDTERERLEAIPCFTFEKSGVTPEGKVLIKIHNGSKIRLPCLTVGVRVTNRLTGAVRLDVSDIGPGETKVVEQDAYRDLVPPESVELFRKPLPTPELRKMYGEFDELS